jgi:hypothetical protein
MPATGALSPTPTCRRATISFASRRPTPTACGTNRALPCPSPSCRPMGLPGGSASGSSAGRRRSRTGYRLRVRSVEERARTLERQVTSRTEELSALNAIAGVVSASLDLEQILDDALAKTLDVMGREAGGIYLLQAAILRSHRPGEDPEAGGPPGDRCLPCWPPSTTWPSARGFPGAWSRRASPSSWPISPPTTPDPHSRQGPRLPLPGHRPPHLQGQGAGLPLCHDL